MPEGAGQGGNPDAAISKSPDAANLTEVRETRKLRGDHCQCRRCGEYFNSTAAFDKHRTGTYSPLARRCRTTAEMRERGMALSGGWWVTAQRADSDLARDSRSGDRPEAVSQQGVGDGQA